MGRETSDDDDTGGGLFSEITLFRRVCPLRPVSRLILFRYCHAAQYIIDAESVHEPRKDGRIWTTVMVRHIPNKYTQNYLIHHFEKHGFR